MRAELLLREFERVSEAPSAVRDIRPFIVELAVKGALTGSAPEALGPDPVSLARIHLGMEALVSTRPRYRWAIAGSAPSPDDAPRGWLATLLANTGLYVNGLAFKPSDWAKTGRPIIRIQNLSGMSSDYNFTEGDFSEDNLADPGDLLVSWSATLDTFIWNGPQGVVNQHIFKVVPNPEAVTREFLYWLLRHEVRQLAQSQHAHGLAMMHINRGPFLSHAVLLPPLSEQRQIVAKMDELMALCDQLEAAQADCESRRDALRAVSLHRLAVPDQDGDKAAHVRFFLNTSPRLITKPKHLAEVRRSILDIAVAGGLIPQDREDVPVSELLGGRALAGYSGTWDLPGGWSWTTLSRLGRVLGGGTPSKSRPEYWNGPIPWVTPKDMKRDRIGDAIDHISEAAVSGSAVKRIPPGSLLMVVRGMILAHSFPTALTTAEVTINQDMKALVPFDDRLQDILLLLTKGMRDVILGMVERSTHGTGRLATADLFELPIPLPPLGEQRRIVAKMDELMALCDKLETALASEQSARARALEALIHDALDGAR